MEGIMGIEPENAPVADTKAEIQQEIKKAGRPRKTVDENSSKEIRATFIVNQDDLQKIKYISLVESLLLKDIIGNAISSYIEEWERENGKIRLPKSKR